MPLLGIVLLVGGTFGTVEVVMAADEPITTPKVTFIERVADALDIEVSDLKDAFAQARDNVQDINEESRLEVFRAELNEILHSEYGVAEDITVQTIIDQIKAELQERLQVYKMELREWLQTCKTEMQAQHEANRTQRHAYNSGNCQSD